MHIKGVANAGVVGGAPPLVSSGSVDKTSIAPMAYSASATHDHFVVAELIARR
jgi:hypothetical protein